MNKQPQYQHDCKSCIFLGRHHRYDLYYHPGETVSETVIARFGNAGPDYMSGLCFATVNGSEPLYQAKLMAIKQGHLKSNEKDKR
jgi:hypothetical protein